MKRLYEFIVNKEEEVTETSLSVNEAGEQISVSKKVKKLVPQKYFIRRPTTPMFDSADLHYGLALSDGMRLGLLTRAQIIAKFSEDNKVYTETEEKQYKENREKWNVASLKYQEHVILKKDPQLTPEEVEALQNELVDLQRQIQEFESKSNSIFDYSAENRARTEVVRWWLFALAYKDDNQPLFKGKNYKENMQQYIKMEEDEDIYGLSVVQRFLLLVSFWQMGRANAKEDFDQVLKAAGMEDSIIPMPEETVEEKK